MRPISDKATNPDEQWGFPDAEVVNHSRDYTSLFLFVHKRSVKGRALQQNSYSRVLDYFYENSYSY